MSKIWIIITAGVMVGVMVGALMIFQPSLKGAWAVVKSVIAKEELAIIEKEKKARESAEKKVVKLQEELKKIRSREIKIPKTQKETIDAFKSMGYNPMPVTPCP